MNQTVLSVIICLFAAAFVAEVIFLLTKAPKLTSNKKRYIIIGIAQFVLTAALLICYFCFSDKQKKEKYYSITIGSILGVIMFLFAILIKLMPKKSDVGYFSSKNITRLAVFTALSYVLYLAVKFPLPIFPSFLDIQISDMPALLAGFMMGPLSGGLVIFLKCLLKLPFTSTSGVGELADLIIGIAYVVPASIFYQRHKNKSGAVASLFIGSGTGLVAAVVANTFILIPFFASQYSWGAVLGMCNIYSFVEITRKNFWVYFNILAVIPFNLLRFAISSVITFLIYKRTGRVLSKYFAPTNVAAEKKPEEQVILPEESKI